MTDTQKIFAQSKANGASYEGDQLPVQPWEWPKETWLRRRMRELNETDQRTIQPDNR